MSGIPPFMKDKEDHNQESEHRPNKTDTQIKCTLVLEQIKDLSEEKYQELSSEFHNKYDNPNIQKKLILGFYGHICEVLKSLQGPKVESNVKPPNLSDPLAKFKQMQKDNANGAAKVVKQAPVQKAKAEKTASKKPAAKLGPKMEKAEDKKEAKKTEKKTEKKTTKKAAPKKAAKKVAKKAAKKTVKKAAPAKAKKAAKKATKAVTKKAAGKKTAKKKK